MTSRSTIRHRWIAVALAAAVVAVVVWLGGSAIRLATGNSSPSSAGSPQTVSLDPSEFSPGACVALSPTNGDNGKTVFLDAGHGGRDPGAIGTTESGATIYEADETLPVELDAAKILQGEGFRVVVSRTTNSSVVRLTPSDVSGQVLSVQGAHDDVVARDVCANDAHANALVGIYFDSGASAENAGCLTAYDADRPFSAANEELASLVQDDVLNAMNAQGWGIPDAGVTPDSQEGSLVTSSQAPGLSAEAASYGHLLLLGPAMAGYFSNPSEMPGAVIEPLFVTDPFEGSIAASAQGQEVIATGIATAVHQFLEPAPAPAHASHSHT